MFVVGGPVTLVLYFFTLRKMSPKMARTTWMLVSPPFALGQAATRAVVQGKIAYVCREMEERKWHAISRDAAIRDLRRAVFAHNLGAYYQRAFTEQEEDPCSVDFFSLSGTSAMPDVLLLACEGLVLFVLVSLSHSGYNLDFCKAIFPDARFRLRGKEDIVDEDVKAEKDLVEHLAVTGASPELEQQGYTLVAQNLHKWFGSFEAVKGINLALRRGECFGLLGVNGAGKSTTFQMLAGLVDLSSGDAYMSDVRLSKSRRQWQSFIGYCPQTNGLLEKLSAFEHLRLFARLRGIPGFLVEGVVQAAISLVDVEKYARNQCGTYSGGNKRKLSIALAILGNPRVIFLDEPFAGIDIVARNTITGRLATMRIEGNVPVVFTSHGMEECETACDRMCIMVGGQMTCLGTLQHLRDKFGTGYTMQLVRARTEPPPAATEGGAAPSEIKSSQTLEEDVLSLFPGARVLGTHDNVHDFHVKEKLCWSTMFEKVALLEESYTFAHVLIQDTNLEQIFISFAEKRSPVTEV
ncbi:phospholipid-transporting ATPase ABCA3-like [Dermacentor variabilis]|uniref:phospholipid-transporting ATPase ABCA3-like n=1 Tax=Dermacentor variabilis TaxID=34621 RepID=UPI003F5C016F